MEAAYGAAPGFGDDLSIDTPEQIALRVPVAGLGSRFLAIVVDSLLQFAVVLLVILGLILLIAALPAEFRTSRHPAAGGGAAAHWGIAIFFFAQFLLYWGYFTLFEAFWNGRTPGKQVARIRVIKDNGRRITLFESMIRNLLRVIDSLPGPYLVGAIAVLANRSNKRLGDLAAGTLVIQAGRDQEQVVFASATLFSSSTYRERPPLQPAPAVMPADALARLGAEDLRAIDHFFERLLDFDLGTRASMADRLAAHVGAKTGVPTPPGTSAENYLEAVAAALRSRGR